MSSPRRLPPHASPRNITELHPEELFDKLAKHDLSEAEARVLNEHLARCVACRAERDAREHFRQALTLDQGALEFALGGVLGQIAEERAREPQAAASPRVPVSPSPPDERPANKRRRASALMLGGFLIAGAAAALGGVAHGGGEAETAATTAALGGASERSSANPPATPARAAKRVVPPSSTLSNGLAIAQAPTASSAQQVSPASAVKRRRSVPPVRPIPPGIPSASSLFRQANEARAQGRLERAEALYTDLIRRYPEARESGASRALLGQLALDHGSPERALTAYDDYIRQSQPALREGLWWVARGPCKRWGTRSGSVKLGPSSCDAFPSQRRLEKPSVA